MSTTALAPAPQRASNSFTLAFGVLNIPLSVYTGTEQTRVERKEFLDGDSGIPVGRSPIRKDTGEVVDNVSVVRMAQASNEAWVVLTDDEIAEADSAVKGVGDVLTFVPRTHVGDYLAEDQAQVRPQRVKGKANPAGEKAFALLLAVLRRKKVVALVRVALRGPARHALLFPDGSFRYIRTADQVREARPLPEAKFSDAELALAEALVEAVGIDTPVLTDTTAPAVRAFLDRKAGGIAPVTAKTAEPVQDDIMAALSASIDAAKAKGKVA
jgi:non-homologous end joining protein Ku